MQYLPQQVCREFESGQRAKDALLGRSVYAQNRLNRRFFSGDQWYDNAPGSSRPLVRLNLVRRIGEYKIGFIGRRRFAVAFAPTGVRVSEAARRGDDEATVRLKNGQNCLGELDAERRGRLAAAAFTRYIRQVASAVRFDMKAEQLLRAGYVTGNAFLYSYFDVAAQNGQGETACEVLPGERLVFADNACETVEEQPYLIVSARRPVETVRRRVEEAFGEKAARAVRPDGSTDAFVTVYAKWYKQPDPTGGVTVWCVETTNRCVVRAPFDTRLRRYPVTAFAWQPADGGMWSQSEVTHLIENQIAVNRLATANVWANISCGMPIMTVNGDTVGEDVTNDPGQILRIYGTNEDVAGAVHFAAPPDCSASFRENAEVLIRQTLACSGAAGLLYRDSALNSTAAVQSAVQAAERELHGLVERYRAFLEDTARVWLDIWLHQYTDRLLCMDEEGERWYFPFDHALYEGLCLDVSVKEVEEA